MEIQLTKPKEIIFQTEIKTTINSLTLERVDDDFTKVTAYFAYDGANRIMPLVLWEGLDYEVIGQWTDSDVAARIKELYK